MSAARDEMFALIARIPGSGTADWCDDARRHLDAYRAEVLREAADEVAAERRKLGAPGPEQISPLRTAGMGAAESLLRRMGEVGAPCPDIHHGLTRPHTTTECPKDGDPR